MTVRGAALVRGAAHAESRLFAPSGAGGLACPHSEVTVVLFDPTPQAVIAGRFMRVPIASFPTYAEALAFVVGDSIGGPLVADAQIRRRADGSFRVVVRTLTSAAREEA